MTKRYCILFLAVGLLSVSGFSQKQYSYMTDRVFKDQLDLYGYNFVPNRMEIPNEMEEDLKMGDYSFGILGPNLYVDGGDIKGVYSINNIDPANYGFKLNLMNARDPTIQGHLKIIQTKYGHVDALVFKRSTKEKEMIFFLPEIPKNLRQQERDYFTDRWELPLKDIDELWGQSLTPFLRVHDDQNIQERLQVKDSTRVTFIEKITKIETKQSRKKRKKKKVEMDNVELGLPDGEEFEEAEEIVIEEEPEPEPEPAEPEVKEKPKTNTNARSSRKRQQFGGYQNTRDYDKEEEEEVVETPEPKAAPKPKSEVETTKEEMAKEPMSGASPEEDGKEYKIIKEYFVNLRSILTYDDGTTEDVMKSFPIKKIIEREDDQAGPEEERFQVEITLKKGDPIYLYLTSERTFSAIEIEGKTYLMRGH